MHSLFYGLETQGHRPRALLWVTQQLQALEMLALLTPRGCTPQTHIFCLPASLCVEPGLSQEGCLLGACCGASKATSLIFSFFILIEYKSIILSLWYYSYFSEEETEAQSGSVTCSWSHNQCLNPEVLNSRPRIFSCPHPSLGLWPEKIPDVSPSPNFSCSSRPHFNLMKLT